MGGVFMGWRRKVGLLTLGMALMFVIGWIRSTVTTDFIRFFPVQFHGVLIVSRKQEMALQIWSGEKPEQQESKPRKKARKKKPGYQPEQFGIHLNEELIKRVPIGSSVAMVFQPEVGHFERYLRYGVPYWSIVLTLTLLSVFLLFAKPRQLIAKKISGPVS